MNTDSSNTAGNNLQITCQHSYLARGVIYAFDSRYPEHPSQLNQARLNQQPDHQRNKAAPPLDAQSHLTQQIDQWFQEARYWKRQADGWRNVTYFLLLALATVTALLISVAGGIAGGMTGGPR